MRRGLALLDGIRPVDRANEQDWLTVRIRLSCLLALHSTEVTGAVADGLAKFDEVRELVASISSPVSRAELHGVVDHNHGTLLMAVGRNDEATAYFDSSIAHKRDQLSRVADQAALMGPYIGTLATRAMACTRLGELGRARADLVEAIELAEKHDRGTDAADVRRTLGGLELRVGDVPAALRHYNESERGYQELGAEIPARLRIEQAQALLAAGLADEAGRHLDEVLPIMREQRSVNRDLSDVEQYRAAAALMNGDLELAKTLAASARRRMVRWGCQTCVANTTLIGFHAELREALATSEFPAGLPSRMLRAADAMPVPRLAEQAAVARMLAARLEIARRRLAKADELVARIPRPGKLTSIDYQLLRRLCRAELAVARGEHGKALAEIRAGLAELDRVRDRMGGGLELVSGVAVHGRELAELAIRLVLADGNARKLFDWLERTRAQTYRYERLARVDDPELAERIAEVRGLEQAIHQAQHDGHPVAALRARHAERLREAHRLGWHSSRWGAPRPVVTASGVAGQLGDRVLVSFATSGGEVVAVVLGRGRCELVRLGPAGTAAENARMLHTDLDVLAPDNLPAALADTVRASARKRADLLDTQLLRPLAGLLGDGEVVVVPTGALYAVPWGVLPSLHGRPVAVAPSATAWLASAKVPVTGAADVVLVCGPNVPGALGEVGKLAVRFRTASVLDGDRATVASVLSELDGAALAHIAAHGSHEPENALFSRLEMTDGSLYAHEMTGLGRPPRQVVFAACDLALNRIRPGDEPLGFASVLLAGGSRTVLAPVCRVGDEAAASTMDDYHRTLAAGASPAAALAEAIAADPFRRPFVCLGAG
ncbi:CHAT domain-containing protein [Amycolatopsis sp. NPDC059027]|uniref:CHAT domain-containing protein n=1 Tax=Amycolatopsis sp. NPDC059027 TaxID=3346709 RepID=UPI00366E0E4F